MLNRFTLRGRVKVDVQWKLYCLVARERPGVLRIIGRFLKAGYLEDGVIQASEQGTPQGGLVSPVPANIYLHYVLDLWFEKRYAKGCGGKGYLVRYADDCVPRRHAREVYMSA